MEKWNMGVAGRMKFIIIKRRALKEIASKYISYFKKLDLIFKSCSI